MKHVATLAFWKCYDKLPRDVQRLADEKFELLKKNPRHPSLHLKRTGKLWSVRVSIKHRVLATEAEGKFIWFWIGTHAEYEELLK